MSLALLFTIALGIGGNVSIRGYVRGLTKDDSPLAALSRMVSVFGQDARHEPGPVLYRDYLSLRSRTEVFEWIAAARVSLESVTSSGHSAILPVAAVPPSLAKLLGLPLDQGVVIRSKEDIPGETVRVGGVDFRVDGVAPASLDGLYRDRPVDLWVTLPENSLPLSSRNFWIVARLRPGVSIQQAQLAVRGSGEGTGDMSVLPYTGRTPAAADADSRIGAPLSLAAGLVFFIACANVASLLLGRASARSKETSMRVALGASRAQLFRGLLGDSIVISVAGGALGLLLAVWISYILPALLFEQDAGHLVSAPDLSGLVAASVIGVLITMACGLLPVLVTSHHRPAAVLRRESAGPSQAIQRLRSGLVVAQMASCCVLVISTAFLFDGLHAALRTSIGHRLGNPILATVTGNPNLGLRYFENVQSAVESVAGVSAIAWTGRLPGNLPAWESFRVEPQPLPLREVTLDRTPFTTRSLELFTLPPAAGRLFGVADQTCRSAVVNQEAATALFGDATPGRSIRDPAGHPIEVIGVLARKNQRPAARPTIYEYSGDRAAPEQIAAAHFRAPVPSELKEAELDSNVVSASYFAALGWPLLAGRPFPADSAPRGCRVGLVNKEAEDLYFAGRATGAAVIDNRGTRTEIIGVVHAAPLGTFQPRVDPAIYFPMAQDYLRGMTVILSAREVSDPLLVRLRSRIAEVPGRGPFSPVVKTLDASLAQTALAPLRIATLLIGAFATMALALSILGLFGVLSDAARQRRPELAIRIALGAQRRHVVALILMEGGRLAFAGTLAGTLGSLLLARILARIAPGNGSPAVWVWVAAPLVLAVAVLMASVLPARRASIVNPVGIMRGE